MKLLSKLVFTVIFALGLPCVAIGQDGDIDLMVQKMLLVDEPGVNKLAAKIAFNEKLKGDKTIELFSYRLTESLKKNSDIDLLSWYTKAIGASRDPRFKSQLNNIFDNTANNKLKKYAKKASKKLGKELVEGQFSVQNFDFERTKSQLKESYEKGLKKVDRIEGVTNGRDIKYVLSTLGLPNNIEQEFVTIRRPYVGAIVTQRLILKYDDAGNVRMGYAGGQLIVERVNAAIEMPKIATDSENAHLIEPILSGTPMQYRQTAQTIYRDGNFEDEILDAAAMRIWQDKDNSDSFAIDGVAWLLKCLGASGNPRYKTFINRVIAESSVRKIQKYAKRASTSLLEGDAEQFSI